MTENKFNATQEDRQIERSEKNTNRWYDWKYYQRIEIFKNQMGIFEMKSSISEMENMIRSLNSINQVEENTSGFKNFK